MANHQFRQPERHRHQPGIPHSTVQRRLAQLERMGAIREQRSLQFMVVPEFMDNPDKLIGFVKRRRHVGIVYKKMHGTAEG